MCPGQVPRPKLATPVLDFWGLVPELPGTAPDLRVKSGRDSEPRRATQSRWPHDLQIFLDLQGGSHGGLARYFGTWYVPQLIFGPLSRHGWYQIRLPFKRRTLQTIQRQRYRAVCIDNAKTPPGANLAISVNRFTGFHALVQPQPHHPPREDSLHTRPSYFPIFTTSRLSWCTTDCCSVDAQTRQSSEHYLISPLMQARKRSASQNLTMQGIRPAHRDYTTRNPQPPLTACGGR